MGPCVCLRAGFTVRSHSYQRFTVDRVSPNKVPAIPTGGFAGTLSTSCRRLLNSGDSQSYGRQVRNTLHVVRLLGQSSSDRSIGGSARLRSQRMIFLARYLA